MAKSAKELAAEKAAADKLAADKVKGHAAPAPENREAAATREAAEQATPGGPGNRLAHAGEEAAADPNGNPENVGRLDPSVATGAMPKLAGSTAAAEPLNDDLDDVDDDDSPSAKPRGVEGSHTIHHGIRPSTSTFDVGGKQDAAGRTAPVHVAGDGPKFPRRAADAPFELHVLGEDAAGNDVTVNQLAGIIREIVADLKAGDVFEAFGDVGTLLGYAQMIFGAGQARPFTSTAAGRREAYRQFGEFEESCAEFEKAKGVMLNKVASADVSVSGAARGMGDGQFGVALAPGDFATIIGVVQTVIDLIRKLKAKRGG